jgi:HPt (histidine-containing phosphotransfer) domain-containing protein
MFQTECPQLMADIRRAVARADAVLLRRGAHTLKNAAAYFGAQPVVDAAFALERMGRENALSDATAALSRLEREAARLLDAVRAHTSRDAAT